LCDEEVWGFLTGFFDSELVSENAGMQSEINNSDSSTDLILTT